MNYLSVCSGIEAASCAWHDLGFTPVAFSEIEPFPCAVLKHRYPNVPNLGDMTKFHEWPELKIDVLVGGCPCQAFSIAGLREGLADPRGNLTLTFLGVAQRYRPWFVVYENVPGILSDRTNAFGCLLAGLAELGYGVAYRLLDAQYFGVAQRRKRVFVVGCLGGWERAAEVLSIAEGLCWHPAPSREAGENIAPTITKSSLDGSGPCGGDGRDGFLTTEALPPRRIVLPIQEIGKRQSGTAMNGVGHGRDGDPMYTLQRGAVHGVAHTLKGEGADASEDGTGRGTPIIPVGVDTYNGRITGHTAATLGTQNGDGVSSGPSVMVSSKWPAEVAPTLNASFGDKQGLEDQHALGGGGCSFPEETSRCLTAKSQRNDAETETLIPMRQGGFFDERAQRFLCRNCSRKFGVDDYPRNPTCPDCHCMTVDDLLQSDAFPEGTPLAFAEPGSPNNPGPIAFSSKDHGADAGLLSPTLRAGNHTGSHANAGVPPAIAFQESPDGVREYREAGCLRSNGPGHDPVGVRIRDGMSVRRLTPIECERLQGFSDNWTNIPWRKQPTSPDGPRYKAIGNSMAVPCMRYIGQAMLRVRRTVKRYMEPET